MPGAKPKRHGPAMDMTAMCDVAFLLLTFFIMTTQFKSQESVSVLTPSSVSKDKVEDTNVGTISIDTKGQYYFGVTEPRERSAFINQLSTDMKLDLSVKEQNELSKMAEVGISKGQIKQYLALSPAQKESLKMTGIPLDSVNTELVDWIKSYQTSNPAGLLAIRGDVKTQYPAIKNLFDQLGKAKIYKFRLITRGE